MNYTTNATAIPVATFSDGSQAITINRYGKGYGIAYAFFPGFHYTRSANWDTGQADGEPSKGTALPYRWGKLQRDIITAPAKIANTPRPITLTQNGKILEVVEACLLESDKGIAIVLLNWSDTPAHVPIKNLTITLNNSATDVPIGSLISSAQGNIVTPKLTTTAQPPFTITLSQLDYVDVIMIDTSPHLVRTETVNLSGVIESNGNMSVVDVSPFHIIGGHLSIYRTSPQNLPLPQVLAAEIVDNQIQHAVSLEAYWDTINQGFSVTDLAEIITGNNPISNILNDTVSSITHILLYNGSPEVLQLNIVLAMTIRYSP